MEGYEFIKFLAFFFMTPFSSDTFKKIVCMYRHTKRLRITQEFPSGTGRGKQRTFMFTLYISLYNSISCYKMSISKKNAERE